MFIVNHVPQASNLQIDIKLIHDGLLYVEISDEVRTCRCTFFTDFTRNIRFILRTNETHSNTTWRCWWSDLHMVQTCTICPILSNHLFGQIFTIMSVSMPPCSSQQLVFFLMVSWRYDVHNTWSQRDHQDNHGEYHIPVTRLGQFRQYLLKYLFKPAVTAGQDSL